jgi:feruloyl esterase
VCGVNQCHLIHRIIVNFVLFLPKIWNNRYIASGNGGFGGGINWNDMVSNVLNGFAAVSTDTGHLSGAFDATWALHRPELIIDWGYRNARIYCYGQKIY